MLRKRIYYAFLIVVVLLGTGTIYYSYAEGWSYIDSFYFSTMTLTTIGFGDLAPTSPAAKIFTSIYALLGIGIMLYILSTVIGVFVFKQGRYFDRLFFPARKIKKKEKEIEKQEKKIEREEERVERYAGEIKAKEKDIEKREKEIEELKRIIKKKTG